jgi:murein DD-endopeptidase MepM/ murein hydrolase activator NlpD
MLLLALTACGVENDGDDGGVTVQPINPTPQRDAPTATAGETPVATAVAPANGTSGELHGFVFPIAGGCLPQGDQLMPNAPRPYRNGIHEGMDLYAVDNCTAITSGTPVVAVKAGRIVRADLNYADPTRAEMDSYLANPNTEESLDKFRGRQVWVDHGGGIVTRYAHLSGIAPGITVGTNVVQGQLIAFVGESGTPESIVRPGSEYHLHFEVRLADGSYLGKGQPPANVRSLYQTFFSP